MATIPGRTANRSSCWPLDDRHGNRMTELVVAPPDGRELTLYESDFIEGLALQAAVALENARYHKRNVEFARVQQDLDAARAIQRSLLPQTLPAIAGYSRGLPLRSPAMRWAATISTLSKQPDGSLLIVVADVAGKGLASAIWSASFRSAFRAMAATGMPLDELATRMNQHHWAEGEEARRRYVTAIFLRLHPDSGRNRGGQRRPQSRLPRRCPVPTRTSSTPPARRSACCPACITSSERRPFGPGVAPAFLYRRPH